MALHGYYRLRADQSEAPSHIEIALLRFAPETIFQLSVQSEANRDHSILRGVSIPGTDFCGAYSVNLNGHHSSGSMIYDGTWTTAQHLSKMEQRSDPSDPPILGFVGAGNITMNPGFVGFTSSTLFYVQGQPFGQQFSCLEFKDRGAIFRSLRLDPANPPTTMGLTGPVLVENGLPAQAADIERMASLGQFYDLRHIIQFPSISWPGDASEKLHIHVGLNCFWKDGKLQPDVVVSALRGEPIDVDLTPYTRTIPQFGKSIGQDTLRARLLAQGYQENPELDAIGDFSIKNHQLRIRYFPGIYNHSIIGTDRIGNVVWLGICGFGNSLGLTMHDTAILAAKHMHNAILVDNGGDVMCRLRKRWFVPSAYDRERIRAVIGFSGLKDPIQEVRTLNALPLKSRNTQHNGH